jgi:hypothetical protein
VINMGFRGGILPRTWNAGERQPIMCVIQ